MKQSIALSALLSANFLADHAGASSFFSSSRGGTIDSSSSHSDRFLMATCPADPLNSGGPTVLYSQDFENVTSVAQLAAEGWVNPALYTSGRVYAANFTGFLGPFTNSSQFPYIPISVTVNSTVVTKDLIVEFDFYEIDSWDGDNLEFGMDMLGMELIGDIIEDVDLGIFKYSYDEGATNGTSAAGVFWSMTSDPSFDVSLGFNPIWSDQKHSFQVSIPNNFFKISGEIVLKFTWKLRGEKDESVGIDNIVISECTGRPDPTPAPSKAPTPSPTDADAEPESEDDIDIPIVDEEVAIPANEPAAVEAPGVVETEYPADTFPADAIVTIKTEEPTPADEVVNEQQLAVFASGDILPYTITIVATVPPEKTSDVTVVVPSYMLGDTDNTDAVEIFAKTVDKDGVGVFTVVDDSTFDRAAGTVTAAIVPSLYAPTNLGNGNFGAPYTLTIILAPTPGLARRRSRGLRGLQTTECTLVLQCPVADSCDDFASDFNFVEESFAVNGLFVQLFVEVSADDEQPILAALSATVLNVNTARGEVSLRKFNADGTFQGSVVYGDITGISVSAGDVVTAGDQIGLAKGNFKFYVIPGEGVPGKSHIDPTDCFASLDAPTPSPSGSVRHLSEIGESVTTEALQILSEATVSSDSADSCSCVDCDEDTKCGGLWRGDTIGGDVKEFDSVYIVLSHCLHSVDWLESFIEGVPVAGMTIVSKCGKSVEGSPSSIPTSIVSANNVGRNDHTYAAWMASAVENDSTMSRYLTDKSAVVFLKDDMSNVHQIGGRRLLKDLLRIVSKNDFACGVKPGFSKTEEGMPISISTYHEGETLKNFHMVEYKNDHAIYTDLEDSATSFASPDYNSLGEWSAAVGAPLIADIAPVCYGGIFAVRGSRIADVGSTGVWAAMELTLSRGNNIEEGHFAERSWAHMLSKPLSIRETMAVVMHSDGLAKDSDSYMGALAHNLN